MFFGALEIAGRWDGRDGVLEDVGMNRPMNIAALMRRLGIEMKPVVTIVDEVIEQPTESVQAMSISERADLAERWNERSAVMEFDGGLDRETAERTAWSEIVGQLRNDKIVTGIPDPMPLGGICPYCESRFLVDDPDGCRCWLCERLAWVTTPDGGIVRADFVGVEL